MAQPLDVIVVGAGAAGLLAGARAAEMGARTLVLEKNSRAGVKILMSGGTRCNVTHHTDRRGIVEAYGPQGPFLHSALAALGPSDLVALLDSLGVATKVESTGKVFPVSDRADDVLSALLDLLEQCGAELRRKAAVRDIRRDDDARGTFRVVTEAGEIAARRVIVTSGGKSYPGSGATGDGYEWARKFGHHVSPLRPALTPITSPATWVRSLRGVTIADARATLRDADGNSLDARTGSLLFTHFGLSGPVILDLSRVVSAHERPRTLSVECDFASSLREEAVEDELRRWIDRSGGRSINNLLADWLGERGAARRLSEALVGQSGVAGEIKAAELSKRQRKDLVRIVKRARVPVEGVMGFRKAEVTAGGVALDEVDSSTMQSKLAPGLFWAGEVLDLDGPIGGFNFQAAFSTGWLAGEKAALLPTKADSRP